MKHVRARGVVASHPLRMRKALGSNPSVSISIIIPNMRALPPCVSSISS